jgi:CHASE3 domain sensor protein
MREKKIDSFWFLILVILGIVMLIFMSIRKANNPI